jgi:hypothetical protein
MYELQFQSFTSIRRAREPLHRDVLDAMAIWGVSSGAGIRKRFLNVIFFTLHCVWFESMWLINPIYWPVIRAKHCVTYLPNRPMQSQRVCSSPGSYDVLLRPLKWGKQITGRKCAKKAVIILFSVIQGVIKSLRKRENLTARQIYKYSCGKWGHVPLQV